MPAKKGSRAKKTLTAKAMKNVTGGEFLKIKLQDTLITGVGSPSTGSSILGGAVTGAISGVKPQ